MDLDLDFGWNEVDRPNSGENTPFGKSARSNKRQDYVAPFLTKAYDIISNPETDDIISWMADGKSFTVWKPAECGRDLLPQFFKHNNFSSFVRQLNTYGFRKTDPDHWQFQHDLFQRGQPELLKDMKRKQVGSSTHDTEARREVLEVGNFGMGPGGVAVASAADVEALRRDKNLLFMELVRLRKEHEQMQASMRRLVADQAEQKKAHENTKATVDKMMNFLVSMFNNSNAPGLDNSKKRKRAAPKRVTMGGSSLSGGSDDGSGDQKMKMLHSRLQELSDNQDQWTAEEQAAPIIMGQHGLGTGAPLEASAVEEAVEGAGVTVPPQAKVPKVQVQEVFSEDEEEGHGPAPGDQFGQWMQREGIPTSNAPNVPTASTSNVGPPPGELRKQWSFGTSMLDLDGLQNVVEDYLVNNSYPEDTANYDAQDLSEIIDGMMNTAAPVRHGALDGQSSQLTG